MSLYILDTDTLSLHEYGHAVVRPHIGAHAPSELATTVITVEEQLSGWYTMLRRSKRRDQRAYLYQRLADQVNFLAPWKILPFPESAILRSERLIALKLNIRKMDLCIAAITLENAGILVTRNVRDFQRVPGLVIEDWTV